MKKLYFVLFLVLAVPAIAYAVSFDCNKAKTLAEHTICSNAELSSLDDQLATRYKEAIRTTDNKESFKADQRKWLSIRNNCRDIECLKEVYVNRISDLDRYTNVVDKVGPTTTTELYTPGEPSIVSDAGTSTPAQQSSDPPSSAQLITYSTPVAARTWPKTEYGWLRTPQNCSIWAPTNFNPDNIIEIGSCREGKAYGRVVIKSGKSGETTKADYFYNGFLVSVESAGRKHSEKCFQRIEAYTYGSPIFKVVREKQCKALYIHVKRSPRAREYVFVEG